MGWVLLAHIGVPFLFGLSFVGFSAFASKGNPTWDLAAESALDLAILSIGATGALFENARLLATFQAQSALVAVTVIAINFLLTAAIVGVRRFALPGVKTGMTCLILGGLTIGVIAGVVMLGYKQQVSTNQQTVTGNVVK